MLRIREVVDSHRETTLHVEGRIVSEWVGGVTFIDPSGVRALRSLPTDRIAIVHALDFIDALLKDDGAS